MQQNVGQAVASNIAMEQARGSYVAFMDADDISLSDRLERQAYFLDTHPNVGLVACGWEVIDEDGSPLCRIDWGKDAVPINSLVARKPHFLGPTMFFRRECVQTVGMYRPGWRMMLDYDLMVRIGERFDIGIVGGIGYKYRLHGLSVCAKNAAKCVRGVVLVRELAEERRLTGTDRLSKLSDDEVQRYLQDYFSAYDKYSSGSVALYYFMLSRRFFCDGAWKAAARYLMKGVMENPLRRDALKLIAQVSRDRRRFNQLGQPIVYNGGRIKLPVAT
jgi:glycosyltransferase involved in cell wall biosynthesis